MFIWIEKRQWNYYIKITNDVGSDAASNGVDVVANDVSFMPTKHRHNRRSSAPNVVLNGFCQQTLLCATPGL
jgi:hypothetical protein